MEDMGEDTEGMVESTSKLRDLVKGMTGFDIMEDEKTFKSIYDIVLGVGEKWEELNDIDRAALLEALAGKRGGNALAATLNNVKDLKESYETALNASGSAAKEQANYERSIQYSIDRLKATAQDLAQDFISSDVIKGAIDVLNKILELIDELVEHTGSLVPIITALGTAFTGIKIHNELGGLLDIIKTLAGKDGSSKGGLIELLSTPLNQLGKNKDVIKKTAETMTDAAQASKTMAEGTKVAAESTEALGGAAAATGMTLGTLVGILAAVGVAIYAGVKAWDYYTTTVEEVETQINETKGKIGEIKSEIESLNSIDDRNEYQNNRLTLLREELKVQQELLDIEEKRRLREKYDTDFADLLDKNNQNAKTTKTVNGIDLSFGSTRNLVTAFVGGVLSKLSENYYKQIGADNSHEAQYGKFFYDAINKWLGNASSTTQTFKNKKTEYNSINAELNKARAELSKDKENDRLIDKVNSLEERQESVKKDLDESILAIEEYLDTTILQANEIEQDLQSGNLSPEMADQAQKNLDALNKVISELNGELVSWQKDKGTFDFFKSYDFSKAIKNDEDALKDLINSEEDTDTLLNKLNKDYPTLIDLMNQEGVSIEDLIKKYREFSEEREKAFNKKFSKSEMIDQISDLSDGFDKLDEIYADVFDKGSFDFTKLSTKKFNEAFKGLEDEYIEFIETVSANPSNLEASQEAFNKLTGAYIEHSGILKGVTENTKDLTINMLENMGVANADEIVTQTLAAETNRLALEKEFTATKCIDLKNATEQQIDSFIKEKKYSDDARIALNQLALEKLNVNNNVLDFSGDIDNLISYVKAITGATSALATLKNIDKIPDSKARQAIIDQANKEVENAKNYKPKGNNSSYFAPTNYSYKGADKTKDAIDKANKSAEESKEIIDWIEKALQRQEEQINRIDKVVNATYKNWSTRNSSLLSEINEINKEIGMQTQAYQAYLRDAEAVPLAEEYKRLVREGAMHAETITDKTLKKNIDQYTELYDKAIKAKDAIADLQAKIAALTKAKFDNVKSEFEGFTSEIEHFVSMIDKELSHVENMEKIAGKSFYNAKIDQDRKKLDELNKERTALVKAMNEAVANGIEEGSADWVAMRNDIYSVDEAIADLTYEVEDLKKKLKEVAKLNFDDLKSQFENALSIINNQKSLTDAVVSLVETSGHMASRAYYEALIEGSKETVTGLRKEYETLSKTLTDAMNAGDIEKYDKQWYEMSNDIASVKNELVEAANATIEYANALRQINWDTFDRGVDTIGKLVDEAEFFVELLSYEDLFDKETGDWTKAGISTRGLMVERYQSYMNQANAYGSEAEEIRKLLETDSKNTTLIDRYYELIEAQRTSILNAKKEKKAVEDLYKDAYDNLLDRIKKLIDAYKNALNAAKDLHDYQNTIEDKTKTINDIQKQLLAYGNGNDTSEENRATLQKLNADLIAAQKDLQETEYDKYIQDQENLLDNFYSDLEEWLNGRMDELSGLFEDAVASTNLNGKLIDNTLHEEANAVNYRMTDEFAGIWDKYADESGIAASSLNILTLVNDMTNSIRIKMDDLPTEARLEEFFNGDDLKLLQELTSVKDNTSNMIGAINETNSALSQIQSNIVEYSGVLANKIDSVANAVNNLDLSVDVKVDASTGHTSVSGGGGGSSSGSGGGGFSKKDTSTSNANHGFKIYNGMGTLVGTADTAQHASQQANVYINSLKSGKNGMPSDILEKMKKMRIVPYKRGGLIGRDSSFFDLFANLLGEDHMVAAKEGERILTEEQNKSFEKMVNANFTPLEGSLKDKYSMLSGVNGDIASVMANMPTPNVGNVSNVGNTTTIGDVHITLPNVTNKEDFINWLKNDGQVERILQAMTVGRLTGGNSYNKMKY